MCQLFMIGIDNNIVTQIYIAGQEIDAFPFKVGQNVMKYTE